ncbi:MAG: 5-methyltetrahydropteroyltriglutamate--homocysteine S-methyltransferase, partial [Corynebacterium camporealensis]
MTNFPKATIEGYPRVGANRELKRALESYWAGRIDAETFESSAHALRLETYNRLRDLGLDEDYAIPADVAYYDQVLETALTVGAVEGETLDDEFRLARGDSEHAPLEMTKWFDTNYHYIVPEIADDTSFTAHPQRVLKLVEEANKAGFKVRPYLVGPVTLLALSKQAEGATKAPLERLDDVLKAYEQVLSELHAAGVEWVQLAEPALVADLTVATDAELADAAQHAYEVLGGIDKRPQLYVTTPYGAARAGLKALQNVDALQVDLSVGTLGLESDYLDTVANLKVKHLVAGLIDGRNVWAANLRDLREKFETLQKSQPNLSVSTSVSLQHVPHTVQAETKLPVDVAAWFSFADEKVAEVVALAAGPLEASNAYAQADRAVRTRAESSRTHDQAVQERTAALPEGQVQREPAFAERNKAQEELGLPKLPTTTIGSFPQTQDIRNARAAHRKGELNDEQYVEALRNEIKSVIDLQERLGLDVLVHGEPERNDMVQYFAELLDGFVTTENGWVQSYGSRCTRPPIVVGDISRPKAMTVEWSKYAQSLSEKHVKGMLTG